MRKCGLPLTHGCKSTKALRLPINNFRRVCFHVTSLEPAKSMDCVRLQEGGWADLISMRTLLSSFYKISHKTKLPKNTTLSDNMRLIQYSIKPKVRSLISLQKYSFKSFKVICCLFIVRFTSEGRTKLSNIGYATVTIERFWYYSDVPKQ